MTQVDTGSGTLREVVRGPIWFSLNELLIRAILQFYLNYGKTSRSNAPPVPAG